MIFSLRKPLAVAAAVLTTLSAVALAPPASADTAGGYFWAVDTSDPITSASIASVRSQANDTPDVWGRYINFCGSACTELSKTEITTAKNAGIPLFFLSADGNVSKSTAGQGTANAGGTVKAAQALGIPKGALLIDDLENDVDTSAAYLENWYKGVTNGGYRVGFYTGSNNFVSQFCAAVKTVPAMKAGVAIDTPDAPGSYGSGGANAPSFSTTKDWPSCGGTHSIWQYSLGRGSNPSFDQDEVDPHLAGLLLPNGTISGGGGGSTDSGYVTSGGWFEHTDSDWHGVVRGKDGHVYELSDTTATQWQTTDLGGIIAGQPSITHVGGNYDYWALSPSGFVYHKNFSNGAYGSWVNTTIATKFDTDYGITALYFGGTYHIFGVGSNGNVYISTDKAGTWTTYNTGGTLASSLGVVYVNGRYDIFGLSSSGVVEHYIDDHGTISAWHQAAIATVYAKGPGLSVIYAQGEYRVFGIGTNHVLYQNYYSSSDGKWHAQSLTDTFGGTPAVTYNSGRYDVFDTPTTGSGNIYQKTFISGSGQSWSAAKFIAYAPGT